MFRLFGFALKFSNNLVSKRQDYRYDLYAEKGHHRHGDGTVHDIYHGHSRVIPDQRSASDLKYARCGYAADERVVKPDPRTPSAEN